VWGQDEENGRASSTRGGGRGCLREQSEPPKIVRSRDEIARDDARSDATRGRGRLRAGRGGGAPAKADACEARADIGLPGRVKPPARGSVGGPGGGDARTAGVATDVTHDPPA
jgi:hypothetical protein